MLAKARSRLTDEVRQQQVAIGQHESNLKAVMDQNVDLREQQEKNNGLSEKFRK
jgi:subtilase family serine protease